MIATLKLLLNETFAGTRGNNLYYSVKNMFLKSQLSDIITMSSEFYGTSTQLFEQILPLPYISVSAGIDGVAYNI